MRPVLGASSRAGRRADASGPVPCEEGSAVTVRPALVTPQSEHTARPRRRLARLAQPRRWLAGAAGSALLAVPAAVTGLAAPAAAAPAPVTPADQFRGAAWARVAPAARSGAMAADGPLSSWARPWPASTSRATAASPPDTASATACGSIACCTCRCTVSMRRMLKLIEPSGTPNSRSRVRSGPASLAGSAARAAGPPDSRRPAQPKPNPWARNRAVAAGGSTTAGPQAGPRNR